MPRSLKIAMITSLLVLAIGAGILATYYFRQYQRRKLAQGTVNDLRVLNAAAAQWALENKRPPETPVNWSQLSDMVLGPLVESHGRDRLGREYAFSTVAGGVKVNNMTYHELSDAVPAGFWNGFEPAPP